MRRAVPRGRWRSRPSWRTRSAVRPEQLDIRGAVLVAVAADLSLRHQPRDQAIWSARPVDQLAGVGGHRDPVPALDEQEVALPPG